MSGGKAARWAATRAATGAATRDGDNWYTGIAGAVAANPAGAFGLQCAHYASNMWQGGNQWAAFCSYLGFFRDVAQLQIDWTKYLHWEEAALHGGPRIMHPEFCMISDFPTALTVDEENRPHNDTGPFCRWSDGTALYSIHGTRVPWWLVEHPERLTRERIDAETNDEVRRVMIERYGLARYIQDVGREVGRCQDWARGRDVVMYEGPALPGEADTTMRVLLMENSTVDPDGTTRKYVRRVPPNLDVEAAYRWTCQLPPGAEFVIRT